MRIAWLALAAVLVALPCPAHADRIDTQVSQLAGAGEYKVRLSAALALSKTKDARAASALSRALIGDSQKTIRRVAAVALGRIVDDSMPKATILLCLAALDTAAANDEDKAVQQSASKSLEMLAPMRANMTNAPTIFVNVAPPADLTKKTPKGTPASLHSAVRQAVRQAAPTYSTTWPQGDLPTKAQLSKAGTRAFFVATTVSLIDVKKNGGRAEVKCAVSVRVNPWEGSDGNERWKENQAASASGSGKVIGSGTTSGIANAMRDCVVAVAEEVTTKQVVPFIRRLASGN